MSSGASSHSWEVPREAPIIKGVVPGKAGKGFGKPSYGAFSGKPSYKGLPVRKLFKFEREVAESQKYAPTDQDKRTYIWDSHDERRIGANGRALNSSKDCRLRRKNQRLFERNNAQLSEDGPDFLQLPDDGAPCPGLERH